METNPLPLALQGRANSDHWSFLLLKMNFFWPAVRAIRSPPPILETPELLWEANETPGHQLWCPGKENWTFTGFRGGGEVLLLPTGEAIAHFCLHPRWWRWWRLLLAHIPTNLAVAMTNAHYIYPFVFDHWSNWNRSVRARARTRSAATKSPAFSPPLWKE